MINLANMTSGAGIELARQKLLGPVMEGILILLYSLTCGLGILSNTALIWVVLGKFFF